MQVADVTIGPIPFGGQTGRTSTRLEYGTSQACRREWIGMNEESEGKKGTR